ncbi:Holliday junction resolvase [Staphylococcus sp. HMSC059E03]|uniref:RusA family crossover junction endodeoxyribonuclease n=2 Tax=Staphylococcus TaxID=1279 RepID=UPI0008A4A26A|nr:MULTISPECIES: RusA family crossover junction endodeoxyribonuclease [unclassified Staphylococcus]OFM14794.1 Holliday junction resolvase [Staphylococcus sp. HMSC059E03]OFN19935.1 Holliday junction resolvase [Staphylococcus sp. HMSC055C03]OFV07324.1 Holliday junction resolvase [Staphylococcus sp. HMSC12H08]
MEIEIKFNETHKAPMASPRPRFANRGKYVQTYMPATYTAHKAFIQKQMPKAMLENNLIVTIEFLFNPPQSWSNKKRLAMIGQYKRTKPDIDNLIKTVLDAANKHLWKDDNQIVEVRSFKKYADESKIVMSVTEVG